MKNQSFTNSPFPAPNLILGLWRHLTRRRRIQLCLLLVVMIASGLAELLSLGAVLPFLAVLSDPQSLWEQPLINEFAIIFGFKEPYQLLIPFTIIFALAAVFAALIRLLNLWLNVRLAAAVGSDLSCEAYRRTLYQPYEVHVQRNTAEVITGATNQISLTVVALNSFLQLITSFLVVLGLLTGLVLVDAKVALGTVLLFGTGYLALAISARRQLRDNSQKISEASRKQLKALQEGLGAIRDVLLDGSQMTYLQIYRHADRYQRQLQAKNNFIGSFPRYSFEALGLVAISVLGGILASYHISSVAVIPLLGTLALGAQRLLPALQQFYSGWTVLNGCNSALQDVLAMLNQPLPPKICTVEPMVMKKNVCLAAVDFRYVSSQTNVIQGLDLCIRRGEIIGLIGTTGSGKSTTADILMGLLFPTSGKVLVDGNDLYDPSYPERILAWRSSIAHVPQNIYLVDSSVAENIAFGIPYDEIDMIRVRKAARSAQIAGFIESMPKSYDTFVGERGIRLSGGQRQRIGIARALYKNVTLLVFDEATSALDNETEMAVMNAVDSLSNDVTVVLIAHRLTTVQRCDRVIRLDNGVVSADGPPSEVLALFN